MKITTGLKPIIKALKPVAKDVATVVTQVAGTVSKKSIDKIKLTIAIKAVDIAKVALKGFL